MKMKLGSPVKKNMDTASLAYLSFNWENQIYNLSAKKINK